MPRITNHPELRLRRFVTAAILGVCASTAAWSQDAERGDGPPPPPPGGGGPGGHATPYTLSGVYSLAGGEIRGEDGRSIASTARDVSGVYVSERASLSLRNPVISTSGGTSSEENSSFYGLNAGVLAAGGGKLNIVGGSIATTGSGANGAFANGEGSSIVLSGTRITATGPAAHGVEASRGGSITLDHVDILTRDRNGAAIATDRGGGSITVLGGSIMAEGERSPAVYSTGRITISGAALLATGAEAAVIEGSNAIMLSDCSLAGRRTCGVMIYQSFSGDAEGREGVFTMAGGSFGAQQGPLFLVTNTNATINLSAVRLEVASGVLLEARAGRWGREGGNGGHATLTARRQTLAGDVRCDAISSATLNLKDGSTLSGAIQGAGLALDASSIWEVGADSALTTLALPVIAGRSIAAIIGHGHTVTYDPASNPALQGATFDLSGGGTLRPR